MGSLPLHVEQPIFPTGSAEQLDECHQSNFGCISPDTGSIEHGLARKEAADTYTVKATGQLPAGRPGLDRVHHTTFEQPPVDPADVAVDPSARPAPIGAALQYIVE